MLRISVGVLFLIFAQYKVFGTQFTLHGGFQFWINRFLEDGAYPFMKPVLKNFVLSHATPLAFLVAYGELAIGFYADSGFGTGLVADPAYAGRINLSPNGTMDLLVEDTPVNTGATPAAGVTTGPSTVWLAATIVFRHG